MKNTLRAHDSLKAKKSKSSKRITNCLDTMKQLISSLKDDEKILSVDQSIILETAIHFLRERKPLDSPIRRVPIESFCNGYKNASNEIFRAMVSSTDISVEFGTNVLTKLATEFNRLQKLQHEAKTIEPTATTFIGLDNNNDTR